MITISANVEARQERIRQISEILQKIAPLAEEVQDGTEALEGPRKELHELIRKATDLGVGTRDLMDLTGYTRQRIWQITGGKKET